MDVLLNGFPVAIDETSRYRSNDKSRRITLRNQHGILCKFPEEVNRAILGAKNEDGTAMFTKADVLPAQFVSTAKVTLILNVIRTLEKAGITVEETF